MTQTIRHHPDPVTLIDYASGALAPALAAVVATHLLLCPRCRTDVKTLEKVGGAMLGQSGDSVAALPAISIPAAHGPDLSKPTEGAGYCRSRPSTPSALRTAFHGGFSAPACGIAPSRPANAAET